ncbi:MAG: hypothetical protein ACLQO1_09630 [Steroidobacteraceae bacterium]
MQTKFSLTEGSIPRALLAFALPILFGNVLQSVDGSVNAVWVVLDRWQAEAIWWSFPIASMTFLIMATGYYRFGGWREIRMGVADASSEPVPTA